ncbi:hypothetical protein SAMN02745157_0778 [Kaistia soli DSM 19436]|uniref:DUF721 domain-containing protein n=1 Tax=Kaistia soli DSM 19436 TaxID=1122133 RepID=A0A1M4VS84_9HYPH|nr:DciA family protein [Kaistia soli]SHE71717.1 hypothetical protein SAMN02745157_0778 [Kaistia soli DSM 19436]
MASPPKQRRPRDAAAIGALVGAVIEPVCAKRGFATADLIQAWAEVVGPRYARATQPDKLIWPRREAAAAGANARQGATLVVRVDAGMAIYLQHETAVILERVNGFLGFGAVSALRIIQGPVDTPPQPKRPKTISPAAEREAAAAVADIESDGLRQALERLGRAVYGEVERS